MRALASSCLLVLTVGISSCGHNLEKQSADSPVVNDVTQINPIRVDKIFTPQSVHQIRKIVKTHSGPISIGGGRYSQGGQTATKGATFIDMRVFNRILDLSPEARTITVEPGITWRRIQKYIDPYGLSVKIMQSFSNFTVGGSLSVNAHGRYVGFGPLIESVRSLKLVLADGTLVQCSPFLRPQLFYGAVGGYGGLGVIVEAKLELVDNHKIERETRTMSVSEYRKFFASAVENNRQAVLHNADLYSSDFDTVRSVTWLETNKPVTVRERLIPENQSYWLQPLLMPLAPDIPFGSAIREYVIDPLRYLRKKVVWRNWEASPDVAEVEPLNRKDSTYVLQEYFVPTLHFDQFVPRLAKIFQAHRVNVVNVSICYGRKDPGSMLAWAQQDVFAFVIYYEQGASHEARTAVRVWTRKLIDAAISLGVLTIFLTRFTQPANSFIAPIRKLRIILR